MENLQLRHLLDLRRLCSEQLENWKLTHRHWPFLEACFGRCCAWKPGNRLCGHVQWSDWCPFTHSLPCPSSICLWILLLLRYGYIPCDYKVCNSFEAAQDYANDISAYSGTELEPTPAQSASNL
jgi:hypothetical protein